MLYRYILANQIFTSDFKLDLPVSLTPGRAKGQIRVKFETYRRKLEFQITNNKLAVFAPRKMSQSTIEHYVRYHALPYMLAQMDFWVLHASCVIYKRRAILFCGTSGVGKSTIAYHLSQMGCQFISDEAVIISWKGSRTPLATSYLQKPRIRTRTRTKGLPVYNNKEIREISMLKNYARKFSIERIYLLLKTSGRKSQFVSLGFSDVLKYMFMNSYKSGGYSRSLNLKILDGSLDLFKNKKVQGLEVSHSKNVLNDTLALVRPN